MKPVIVIGRIGAGKSTLLKALAGSEDPVRKTQMVEFHDWVIDTPGEYVQIPRFHSHLISLAMKAAVVLVVQDAVAESPALPPGFCRVFPAPVLGVVTKMDRPDAQPERAERHLQFYGVNGPYLRVSAVTGEGLEELRRQINRLREEGST